MAGVCVCVCVAGASVTGVCVGFFLQQAPGLLLPFCGLVLMGGCLAD